MDPSAIPSQRFDLAVVGGGALGCALAWEAATRGVKVVLLEQDDFGSGASANSLKIVHGGLRYLQKLDIRRARASAAERSTLLRIAPHLVEPLPCVMPTRRNLLRGRLAMAGGLMANALVTFDRNRGLRKDRRLPAGGLIGLETLAAVAPGLNLEGVTAGARWFDARMIDSERLPLAFALGAEAHGAVLLNHHRVTEFTSDRGRITGVLAEDRLAGSSTEIRASVVADCRCSWAQPGGSPPGPVTAPPFTRAVNLILPGTPLQCALGFPMRDSGGKVIPGRMLFAMPWKGVTLVGTWYSRAPEGAGAGLTPADLEAMLASVNASYGAWRFQPEDVRAFHVGLLPAIPESVEGEDEPVPMEKPRCEPATDTGGPAGLWYLQTEKWTTVRRLAQACVDRLSSQDSLRATPSRTSELPLPDGVPEGLEAVRGKLRQSGLPEETAKRIESAYGSRASEVLEFIASSPAAEVIVPASGGVRVGELLHAMEREHARTLGDLMRRTGIGSAGWPALETLEFMARIAAAKLDWPDDQQARQVGEVLQRAQYRLAAQNAALRVDS